MFNLLKADLYKLKKSKALKICFLISLISAALLAAILYNVSNGNIGKEMMGSVSLLVDAMMVSLLASLMIGVIICGDFQSKNIHSEITCARRSTVVLTKVITSMLITSILILPYAVVAVIGFASKAEFAALNGIPSLFINVLTNKAGVAADGSEVGKSIGICLIGILIYTARLSICVPVAFKVRKSAAVMTVGIVAAFGFDMIVKALEDVPVLGYLFTNTPYAVIYDVNMNAGPGVIIRAIVVSAVFIFIMAALTYVMFRKAEIK